MRILTVLDSYPPDLNGGAYFMHRLARTLVERGHEVLVVCPSRTLRHEEDTYEGVRTFRLRSYPLPLYDTFRVCWPVGIEPTVHRAVADFAPDVVHLQGKFFLGGMVFRAARAQRIPLVATNHFMPENFFHYTRLPPRFLPWFKRVTWGIVLDMLAQVDAVTTPTPTAARLLREAGLARPVHAISCGVDLGTFRPGRDASGLRKRLGIDARPVALYTGRLDEEKRLPDVLRAFARVRARLDVRLVLVGMGSLSAALKRLARGLGLDGSVTFTGRLSDAEYPDAFGLADFFVHAGVAELQSICALEAAASGLPLVCARAMALPELVREGENGFGFEPGDEEALAEAMIRLFSDTTLREAQGRASRALAERHGLAETAAQYERVYESIQRVPAHATSSAP
jgi:1,2-diacylglycerol 3-alpha-glucosyltransferase